MPGSRTLQAGATLGGRFHLIARIATGGMGDVWRARNETTGAAVALKVLRAPPDELSRARMRSEARLGSKLHHRSIVKIFDLLEAPDGDLVLVMELLRGESLAHHLERRGTLPTKEAVAVAVPVLSALAHAHDAGIVHRDVTPANVFLALDPDGHVTPKLVDFGIAKIPRAGGGVQTLPGSVLGTPRYMSPEQIRGGDIDGRSDLFSVATVLYEAITGASPFEASTPAASLASVLETEVDPDGRIDPKVWVVVARALAKRPYERPAGAKAMAAELCEAVGANEASLATLLEREPPLPGELDIPAGGDAVPAVTTVEGQSFESHTKRRSRLGWIVGLAAAAGVALLAAPSLRAPAPGAHPGVEVPPPGSSHRQDAPVATAAGAEPTVASATPPVAATVGASSAASTGELPRPTTPDKPVAPVRPAKKTRAAVATTPGF